MDSEGAANMLAALQNVAHRCRGCGACASVCDILPACKPLLPGNIARQVLEDSLDPEAVWFIPHCSLCGRCKTLCPECFDLPAFVVEARRRMIDKGLIDAGRYRAMWVDYDWNAITLYRDTYRLDVSHFERARCDVVFMPGCSLLNEGPELVSCTLDWLEEVSGMTVGLGTDCCGMPLYEMGLLERTRLYEDRLWEKICATGARMLVLACPNCMGRLAERGVREGLEIRSLYELMASAGLRAPALETSAVTVHDSCPARGTQTGTWVRSVLADFDIIEMEHCGDCSTCCGSGGAVSLYDYPLRERRAEERVGEFLATGVPLCVTYCMSSCSTLTLPSVPNRVRHILELVFEKPIDHVGYQQKVQGMWEGEWGEYNSYRLQNSCPLTQEEK